MLIDQLYLVVLVLFGLGIISAIVTQDNSKITNYIAHGLAASGCLAAAVCAIAVLGTQGQVITFSLGAPLGVLKVRIDYLAAYFLLTLGVVGTATSIYAIGYSREYYGRRFAVLAALFNAFLLSMVLVLTMSQVVVFVIVWELMTVVSFFLVNHEYEKTANTNAAYLYILMTHVGTAFIAIAFLLLATGSDSLDFALLNGSALPEPMRNAIFLCALIGFGTKAGVMPLHIWLPEAHPAAPSHVSAMMSGIMIKTAIYGMARFFLDFLGVGPAWWGGLVLVLAIISSVLGVLYAIMEHDLKRLLAYHSVENIGIILLGVGAGMVFMSYGQPTLAGLAWAAALYHVFNHAIFKSLLFMGAGAVMSATHTKEVEHLGGLIKKMPYTALFFLIGAAAISALPPLNGFVSEWFTFQALFLLPAAIGGVVGKLSAVVLIALLGLTGALAAACFVKAFGVTFLAKPRSLQAEQAVEVPGLMLTGMGALALICVAAGVWPQWMVGMLQTVVAGHAGVSMDGLFQTSQWYAVGFQVQPGSAAGLITMPVVAILIVIGLIAAYALARAAGNPKAVAGETWTCGINPTARMEYTATGFAEPIRRVFGDILRPVTQISADQACNPYHGVKMSLDVHIRHLINEYMYSPLANGVLFVANSCKRIQAGSLQLYIGYIMVVTVVVMIIGTRW
ncbi:hydrogenase 4 subunit B [Sporomusa termitida]|uniref:Hydrogenase-4 component B n=1 Tax=Sporomusa termitida TaxID=2377 RepID=A0A517DYU5_9FIRM|nr:hydrogenase 4 subunit B [Sporomusa termitida]QDR82522.1 Hydrogenase-4 component B [Sporomusa termitida]